MLWSITKQRGTYMTQKQFYALILTCNILFLFIYIFKQNSLISLAHAIQKKELYMNTLQQKKEQLFNQTQKLQQHATIKKRVEHELSMRKKNLQQITPLPSGTI